MKLFMGILVWLVVLAFFPLIAIAVLILWPMVWLISLPVRLIAVIIDAAFCFLKSILFLPARLLGHRQPA